MGKGGYFIFISYCKINNDSTEYYDMALWCQWSNMKPPFHYGYIHTWQAKGGILMSAGFPQLANFHELMFWSFTCIPHESIHSVLCCSLATGTVFARLTAIFINKYAYSTHWHTGAAIGRQSSPMTLWTTVLWPKL